MRTTLFSQIPARDDRGVDDDYRQFQLIRGLLWGLLFSSPCWAAIGYILHHLMKAGQ